MNKTNKKIVKVLRGLPASGKSTIAKELVKKDGWVRINNDDLRTFFHNDRKFNKKDEDFITSIRLNSINIALEKGFNIVLDNLNLHPKHIEWIENRLKEYPEYELQIEDVHCEPEVCMIRDSQRYKPVGDKVIMEWYNKYLNAKVAPRKQDINLQKAICVDIDGTVAHNDGHRGFFDETKVYGDKPHQWVIDTIKMFRNNGHYIIFCSGRTDSCKEDTEKWIRNYIFNDEIVPSALYFNDVYKLFMRKSGDMRKDSIIKKEIYENEILPNYNVVAVFDDRLQVVRMLRNELGLNVFQVQDGLV